VEGASTRHMETMVFRRIHATVCLAVFLNIALVCHKQTIFVQMQPGAVNSEDGTVRSPLLLPKVDKRYEKVTGNEKHQYNTAIEGTGVEGSH
jgi:hypothetical protein